MDFTDLGPAMESAGHRDRAERLAERIKIVERELAELRAYVKRIDEAVVRITANLQGTGDSL